MTNPVQLPKPDERRCSKGLHRVSSLSQSRSPFPVPLLPSPPPFRYWGLNPRLLHCIDIFFFSPQTRFCCHYLGWVQTRFSCFGLASAGTPGVCHHAWLPLGFLETLRETEYRVGSRTADCPRWGAATGNGHRDSRISQLSIRSIRKTSPWTISPGPLVLATI